MSAKASWTRVAFGDVVRLARERSSDPEEDGFDRYVGLEHIDPGHLTIRRWGNLADGTTFTNVFRAGQVLFGKRRAYQRKVAVADFDGVCSGDIYVFEPKGDGLLPELLPYICQTDGFFEHAIGTSAGSLSPRTNWNSLVGFELPLPPIDVQRRIVEALAAIDRCRERYRLLLTGADCLIASFLDDVWARHGLAKISTLVDSAVIAPPQDGNHGEKHPTASDYVEDGVPFLMASDLQNGTVDLVSCKKIPQEVAVGLRIGFAKAGDVLLSHKGTVGAVARLTDLSGEFVMLTPQVTYYRVLDRCRLHPDWLFFCFKSPAFQRLLERRSKQSTRAYIGITAQQDLEIPYCSVEDQEGVLAALWRVERTSTATQRRDADACVLRRGLLHRLIGD
ncbi:MAG: restriction endonuclease subunit S [Vicinamibacterales bacterium]